MKHGPLCLATRVHTRTRAVGSSLVTLYHKHWTVIRFSTHLRLCVFMQLKGIGLYQTADYYLLHWVREDLIQLANSPFPPPRFKERIIFFPFFSPSLLLSPADASQESEAAKAAIKMHLSPLNSAGTRTGAYRYCVLASRSWKQIAEQAASLLCVLKTH